ncbi:hypothetical protein CRM22_004518 [Opisthorchis felineus]|uniref:ALMS motif domain-containing protein n=1 Tax=Opisthorchis felineus TaxID=147828 RepID=A0A4S2M242_OPIFE|nr:hypothetical protein CRM22_004518 [Opisthorchis felineus]
MSTASVLAVDTRDPTGATSTILSTSLSSPQFDTHRSITSSIQISESTAFCPPSKYYHLYSPNDFHSPDVPNVVFSDHVFDRPRAHESHDEVTSTCSALTMGVSVPSSSCLRFSHISHHHSAQSVPTPPTRYRFGLQLLTQTPSPESSSACSPVMRTNNAEASAVSLQASDLGCNRRRTPEGVVDDGENDANSQTSATSFMSPVHSQSRGNRQTSDLTSTGFSPYEATLGQKKNVLDCSENTFSTPVIGSSATPQKAEEVLQHNGSLETQTSFNNVNDKPNGSGTPTALCGTLASRSENCPGISHSDSDHDFVIEDPLKWDYAADLASTHLLTNLDDKRMIFEHNEHNCFEKCSDGRDSMDGEPVTVPLTWPSSGAFRSSPVPPGDHIRMKVSHHKGHRYHTARLSKHPLYTENRFISERAVSQGSFISSPEARENGDEGMLSAHIKNYSYSTNVCSFRSDSPMMPLADGILDELESDEEVVRENCYRDSRSEVEFERSFFSNHNVTMHSDNQVGRTDELRPEEPDGANKLKELDEIYRSTSQSVSRLRQQADRVLEATERAEQQLHERFNLLSLTVANKTEADLMRAPKAVVDVQAPTPRPRSAKRKKTCLLEDNRSEAVDEEAAKPNSTADSVTGAPCGPILHSDYSPSGATGHSQGPDVPFSLPSLTSEQTDHILPTSIDVREFVKPVGLPRLELGRSTDGEDSCSQTSQKTSTLPVAAAVYSDVVAAQCASSPLPTEPTIFSAITNVTPLSWTPRRKPGDPHDTESDSRRSSLVFDKPGFRLPQEEVKAGVSAVRSQVNAVTDTVRRQDTMHTSTLASVKAFDPSVKRYSSAEQLRRSTDILVDRGNMGQTDLLAKYEPWTIGNTELETEKKFVKSSRRMLFSVARSETDLFIPTSRSLSCGRYRRTSNHSVTSLPSLEPVDRCSCTATSGGQEDVLDVNNTNSQSVSRTVSSANPTTKWIETETQCPNSERSHRKSDFNHSNHCIPLSECRLYRVQPNSTQSSSSIGPPIAASSRVGSNERRNNIGSREKHSDLGTDGGSDLVPSTPLLACRPPMGHRVIQALLTRNMEDVEVRYSHTKSGRGCEQVLTDRATVVTADTQKQTKNDFSVSATNQRSSWSNRGDRRAHHNVEGVDTKSYHLMEQKRPGERHDGHNNKERSELLASQLRYMLLKHRMKLSRAKEAYRLRRRVVHQLEQLLYNVPNLQDRSLPPEWDTDTSSLVTEQTDTVPAQGQSPEGSHPATKHSMPTETENQESETFVEPEDCNMKQSLFPRSKSRPGSSGTYVLNDSDHTVRIVDLEPVDYRSRKESKSPEPHVQRDFPENVTSTGERLCMLRDRAEQQLAEMITILMKKKSQSEKASAGNDTRAHPSPLPSPPSYIAWTEQAPYKSRDLGRATRPTIASARAAEGGLTWFQTFSPIPSRHTHVNQRLRRPTRGDDTGRRRTHVHTPPNGKISACGGDCAQIRDVPVVLCNPDKSAEEEEVNTRQKSHCHRAEYSGKCEGNLDPERVKNPGHSGRGHTKPERIPPRGASQDGSPVGSEIVSDTSSEAFPAGLVATPRGVKFSIFHCHPPDRESVYHTTTSARQKLHDNSTLVTGTSDERSEESALAQDLQTLFRQRMSRWISRSRERQKRIQLAAKNRRYTAAMNAERVSLFVGNSRMCSPTRPLRRPASGQSQEECPTQRCSCSTRPFHCPARTLHTRTHCCSANTTRMMIPLQNANAGQVTSRNPQLTAAEICSAPRDGSRYRGRPRRYVIPREQQRMALEHKMANLRTNRLRMKIYGEKVLRSVLQRRGPWSLSFKEI